MDPKEASLMTSTVIDTNKSYLTLSRNKKRIPNVRILFRVSGKKLKSW